MIWPESDEFRALRSEVEAYLPQSLLLRNISAHPNPEVRKQSGRYEQAINTIWINPIYTGKQKLYIVSHELLHAWQYTQNYPRVHAVYAPQNIPEENEFMRDLTYKIFFLADCISNVFLDPAADRVLFARNIVPKEAITKSLPKISPGNFSQLDPSVFSRELSGLPGKIKKKVLMTQPQGSAFWLDYGLGVVTNACVLAAGVLCLRERGSYDQAMGQYYQQYPNTIRTVADRLENIVGESDLDSLTGCRSALNSILQYLNIPHEVMTLY